MKISYVRWNLLDALYQNFSSIPITGILWPPNAVFQYNAQYHKVLQVNREDYNSCSAKSAVATYETGNDSINFASAGDYYYISSLPAQCDAGQRLHIKVGSIYASLPDDNTLSLGKVPKPPIPFPPHVVAHPYPRSSASTSLSSKCLITTMLGLMLVADFYFFFCIF